MSPPIPGKKAFAATFFTSVWIQLLTLGTGALTARLLGPEGRGQFAAAQVWPSILATIALLGVNTALAIHAAKFPDRIPTLERLGIRGGVLSSLVAMIAGWFLVPALLPSTNPTLIPLARLYLIFVPISVLTTNLMAIDQGSGNFKQFNIARNVITPVYLTLLCLLWMFGVRGVAWFLAALLTGNFAVLLYRLMQIKPMKWVNFSNPIVMRRLIHAGAPFWITSCILILRDNAERLLLIFLLGPVSLGLYAVAFTAASVHLAVTNSLNLVVFSRAAALDKSLAFKDAARVFRTMGLVNFAMGLGMVVAQPIFIPLIFGKTFNGAIVPAMLLVAAQFFQSEGSVLYGALWGQGRPFIGLTAALLSIVVFAGSGYWLSEKLGLVGVAIASICSQACYCGAMMAALKRIERDVDFVPKLDDIRRVIAMLTEAKVTLLRRLCGARAI